MSKRDRLTVHHLSSEGMQPVTFERHIMDLIGRMGEDLILAAKAGPEHINPAWHTLEDVEHWHREQIRRAFGRAARFGSGGVMWYQQVIHHTPPERPREKPLASHSPGGVPF